MIKVQRLIYQWICLDKLYKLMESFFFQISNSFSNYWLKTEKYSREYRGVNIDQIPICYISIDSSQQALQKFFIKSFFIGIIFRMSYTFFKIIVAFLYLMFREIISTNI